MSTAGGEPGPPHGLLTSRSFRIRHSLWTIGPILGWGFVTWASFLYIGLRARRWTWVLAGIGYAVGTAWVFYALDATAGPDGEQNDWVGGVILALWITGIVHALLVNPSWLRWRASRVPWWATAAPALAPPPVPPHSPPEVAALDVDPNRYWGPGQLIDVNTARPDELAALPGMTPERARRALQERQARGGFASVAEFADATGLQPHEHSRIRALVTCSPFPRRTSVPGQGRVLDY